MALSGSFSITVSTGYVLSLEWTATQNVSNNSSTVTAKLYWLATSGSYNVVSSGSKPVVININGNKLETTSIVGLGYGGMRTLATHTVTVPHNSDGTKSISIGGACTFGLTLNGQSIGYKETGGTITLNTIPRASTMSSSADMTAGFSKAFTLNTASSSFTHTVKMYVGSTLIKSIEGVKSSGQFDFSLSELGNIFTAMAQAKTATVKFSITTYSNGSTIGTSEKSGTITAPSMSSWLLKSYYNIGDTIGSTINKPSSNFTVSIGVYTTDGGTLLAWLASQTSATTLSYNTSNIASAIYAKIPNSTYYDIVVKVFTYCNGVQVNGIMQYKIRMYVANSEPTFTNSAIYCWDSNSTTSGVTGNNQYVIQNKSNLYVRINSSSKATANNSATMSHYIIDVVGKTFKSDYSTSNIEVNIGTIDASENIPIKVTAVDSRGLQTTVSKIINVIQYNAPTLTVLAARTNNFENETSITAKVTCSAINIGGTNKNTLPTLRFGYRLIEGSYSSWIDLSKSGFPSVTGTYTIDLPNTNSYEIKVQAIDGIGTIVEKNVVVGSGKPILYIDTDRNSIGINQQTTRYNSLEVTGKIEATDSIYSVEGIGTQKYFYCGSDRFFVNNLDGINMNNSDIRGCNAIVFGNECDSNSEGILFPKSGITNSTSASDYYQLRVQGGTMYVGDEVAFAMNKSNNLLKDIGGLHMTASETGYTPSKPLASCENGWLLIWSGYNTSNSTVENTQWNYQFIPKEGFSKMAELQNGSPLIVTLLQYYGTPARKYLYTNGIVISGHSSNTGSGAPGDQYGFHDNKRMVLRWVYEY